MPKTGRHQLQDRKINVNPASLIAFHCAKKFREYHPDAPPLRWCWVVGLFALQGDHKSIHEFFPDEFLRESFLRRKDWTIFALDWIRSYYDSPFMYAAKGRTGTADRERPKLQNHALLAALYACSDNRSKVWDGEPIDEQHLLEAAKKYGLSTDWTKDALSQAVKEFENLRAEYNSNEWRVFEKDGNGFF